MCKTYPTEGLCSDCENLNIETTCYGFKFHCEKGFGEEMDFKNIIEKKSCKDFVILK